MKFLDKLPQYPGCIYVIDELWLPEAVSSVSVEDVVEHYIRFNQQRDYDVLTGQYHYITILNRNADGIIPEIPKGTTYRELKALLDSHVSRKNLIVKPDFSELCTEFYDLDNNANRQSGQSFCFDYGILYGDYQLPEEYKIYKTDCRTKEQEIDNLLGYDLVLIENSPRNHPDATDDYMGDPYVALMGSSVIGGRYYEFCGPYLPIASLSEFDPEKDFDIEKMWEED